MARRVHDSPTLQEKFEKLVDAQIDHSGQQRSLIRRVPTRWNSDLACLASHIEFETPVKQLTSSDSSLKKFALSEAQWVLAKQLTEVLEVSLPKCFSICPSSELASRYFTISLFFSQRQRYL